MAGIAKNIAKIIVNILMTVVFIILILIIIAKVSMLVNNKSYFEAFGYSFFNVATGSMEPAISQNDIIVVEKADNYEVGDIVTFEKDGNFITHRIVLITEDLVTTKGDANNTSDVSIKKDLIIGKVTKIYSSAGIWQKIFTTPQIIVAIFITLILFDFAFSYKGNKNVEEIEIEPKKEIKEKKPKKVVVEEPEEEEEEEEPVPVVKKKKKEPKVSKRQKLITTDFSDEDTVRLYKKIRKIKQDKSKELTPEEEYTIRLDLTGMQKAIEDKINKEE